MVLSLLVLVFSLLHSPVVVAPVVEEEAGDLPAAAGGGR